MRIATWKSAGIALGVMSGVAFFLSAIAAPPRPATERTSPAGIQLTLDPSRSKVHYTVDSTLHTVHGTFNVKSGTLTLDPASGKAKGEVIVSQKDQIATGDNGTFDMLANTVTLYGGVVVTQGQNVLKGERLVVDLTTGVSRVEAGRDRVRAIISQGGGHSGDVTTGTVPGSSTVGTPSTGRDPPKVHPASPSGLY